MGLESTTPVVVNTFNPFDRAYVQELILLSLPGTLTAYVCLIVGLMFCFFRSRGRCGGNKPPPEGYGIWERRLPKGAMFVLSIIVMCMLVLGVFANWKFTDALWSFIDNLQGYSTIVEADSAMISQLAETTNKFYSGSFSPSGLYYMMSAANATTDQIYTGTTMVKAWNEWRVLLVVMSIITPGLCILSGSFSAAANKKDFAMGCAVLGFTSLVIIWTTVGFHLPTSVMLSDYCRSLKPTQGHVPVPPADTGDAFVFVSCPNATAYSPVFKECDHTIGEVTVLANRVLRGYNIDQLPEHKPWKMGPTLNHTIGVLLQNMSVSTFEAKQSGAKEALTRLKDLRRLLTVAIDTNHLASCDPVVDIYDTTSQTLCRDLKDAVHLVLICMVCVGILMFFVTYVGVLGHKRFRVDVVYQTIGSHRPTSLREQSWGL